MSKFSNWVKANVSKAPADVNRRGLGKWFQVLEERFMPMFWSNLLTMGCMTPACVCLFFHMETRDWLSLAAALVCFSLASPALVSTFFICMQAVRENPTWVWDSFKTSYTQEGKKAIPLGLLVGILWTGYLWAVGLVLSDAVVSAVTLVMLAICGIFLAGFSFFSFQQLATVELPFHGILRNGILLILAGKGRSLVVSLLTLAAVLAGAWYSVISYCVLLVGVLAIGIMTGELIFFPVFEMLFLDEDGEE